MIKTLPWIARAALLFAVLDFGTVGSLYILRPAVEAANATITAAEAAGLTNLRVGFGAFHFGVALIAAFCLLKPERILTGLSVVCAMTATGVAVRIFGLMVDGWHPRTILLLQLECLGLVIFLAGLWAERRRLSATPA
ncbi:MAG: DUF4345 domain-containing protein [Rhodospirillaceae bacterium]|nr:DUF4345 domain-containing protein [Rhodospirillaceae bacterium]